MISDAPDGYGQCALCRASNLYTDLNCRACGATLPWAVMGLGEGGVGTRAFSRTWSPAAIRDPGLVLLLCVVTLGTYYLWWIYMVSSEVSSYLEKVGLSAGMEVTLTSGTCGLYNIYWNYKLGGNLARMLEKANRRPADNSILYAVLSILGLFFINAMMQQATLNEIWRAEWANQR